MLRPIALPLLLCAASSALSQVQIDFSRYPDGQEVPGNQVITDEWRPRGVLFAARAASEPVGAQGTVWPFVGGAGVDCVRYYFFTPDVYGAVGIFRFVVPGTNDPIDVTHFEMVAGWNPAESLELVGLDENDQVVASETYSSPGCGFCEEVVSLTGRFCAVELRTFGNPGIGFQNCSPAGGYGLRFTPVLGESYCSPAVDNSTGVPGVATVTGSFFVSDNDVTLTATDLPAGQFGYFLLSETQGAVQPPGSQGILCLGGKIGRFNKPQQVIQGPADSVAIDLTSIPIDGVVVDPGETWNFQCWYRDVNPGQTSNFTDAVQVTFQ